MPKKIKLNVSKTFAITINRTAIKADKLVYVAKANKKLRYHFGRSHILTLVQQKLVQDALHKVLHIEQSNFLTIMELNRLNFISSQQAQSLD